MKIGALKPHLRVFLLQILKNTLLNPGLFGFRAAPFGDKPVYDPR